jgi:hypothetical protein
MKNNKYCHKFSILYELLFKVSYVISLNIENFMGELFVTFSLIKDQ